MYVYAHVCVCPCACSFACACECVSIHEQLSVHIIPYIHMTYADLCACANVCIDCMYTYIARVKHVIHYVYECVRVSLCQVN